MEGQSYSSTSWHWRIELEPLGEPETVDWPLYQEEPEPAVSGNCIDNQGRRTEHRATGYLMSEGRRIAPQCEQHAAEIIAEYATHGLTDWSFLPARQI